MIGTILRIGRRNSYLMETIILPQVPGDLLFELILGMLGMAGILSFDKLRGITR